jgi:hypothetical protein
MKYYSEGDFGHKLKKVEIFSQNREKFNTAKIIETFSNNTVNNLQTDRYVLLSEFLFTGQSVFVMYILSTGPLDTTVETGGLQPKVSYTL